MNNDLSPESWDQENSNWYIQTLTILGLPILVIILLIVIRAIAPEVGYILATGTLIIGIVLLFACGILLLIADSFESDNKKIPYSINPFRFKWISQKLNKEQYSKQFTDSFKNSQSLNKSFQPNFFSWLVLIALLFLIVSILILIIR